MSSNELLELFTTRIYSAIDNKKIKIDYNTSNYLVWLMMDSVKIGGTIPNDSKVYLIDLYQKCAEATTKVEAFNRYKFLGDHSLIMVGCFSASIKRKIVSINYYTDMGIAAYGQAAALNPRPVYKELSSKYYHCSEILNEAMNTMSGNIHL